jgi:hypothetical protein
MGASRPLMKNSAVMTIIDSRQALSLISSTNARRFNLISIGDESAVTDPPPEEATIDKTTGSTPVRIMT